MAVKARSFAPHAALRAEQKAASDPAEHVWLSASAGTGKTYVLSARVLRLLLRGVAPDAILCLTFTKSGAAEMAERVHTRLAGWVRLDGPALAAELKTLDEDFGPASIAVARTLFANVLESRGGGLRIMTIHAFCQTLLAGFPLEAGISPGFRPLEGREEALLAQNVLSELIVTAEREGDARLLGDVRAMSMRLGEDGVVAFLKRAAPALETLEALGPGVEATVRRAMDVPAEYSFDDLVAACADDGFDRQALLDLSAALDRWGSKRATERGTRIAGWLLGTAEQRAAELPALARAWCKADGTLFAGKGWVPDDPGYDALVEKLDAWCRSHLERAGRAALAADTTAALRAAQRFARAYADAKRARGLVDFDDQIRLTRALLVEPGMGDWIRYKLDSATDHILVDESQDTNRAQWDIVDALAAEFWTGEGARGDRSRTIFAVGDYKQAIYGFQGTDPRHYERAGLAFDLKAVNANQTLRRLSVNRSFRSSPPVLAVVDAVLDALQPEALGLIDASAPHVSANGGPGEVVILPPVTSDMDLVDEGEEGWIPNATRDLATKLARQVRSWIAEPLLLAKDGGRPLQPGDVMILVRARSDLAPLLVARLQEEGVPVAGVDRLKLKTPLAVQDLLAAARFAAQPDDDLNLASLLVSPLMGWSQDALLDVAFGRPASLWAAIPPGPTRDALGTLLRAADFTTPYAFFENLLSGALQGRRKLIARLGEEARDPVDELLNAAIQFERDGLATLQPFLDWFDSGETDIVRDAGAAGGAVRVMTVHGAKGLQAPLIILADACADPDRPLERNFKWTIEGVADDLPLFRPRSAERALIASLQESMDDHDDRARKEHWRLLYVAMTRAEERLVIAGSLGSRAKGVVPPQSWHSAVECAMITMGAERSDDALWGSALRYGDPVKGGPKSAAENNLNRPEANASPLPSRREPWLDTSAPLEARPPRPLAPSAIGQDDDASPPPGAAMAQAGARGRLLHALFERLPSLPASERRAAGLHWLASETPDPALVDVALNIIEDPRFAAIFAAGALAEAPIAGVVDGLVVSGTVDRLAIGDGVVDIIDFKTGSRVPQSADQVPIGHVRQMAAYAAVVAGIFPDFEVRASLLYSHGPVLLRLPPALLAAHKPGFTSAQDKLPAAG